jgi:hypothetical protein
MRIQTLGYPHLTKNQLRFYTRKLNLFDPHNSIISQNYYLVGMGNGKNNVGVKNILTKEIGMYTMKNLWLVEKHISL